MNRLWKFPKGVVDFIEGSDVVYKGLVKSWQGSNYRYTYIVSLVNGDSYEGVTNEMPSYASALRKMNRCYKRSIEEREFFV